MTLAYEYDIYAAGPFFNEQQRAVMDEAIKGLREIGYKVCDPRDLSPVLVDMDPEQRKAWAKEVFDKNIVAIDNSYMVIACIDDRDTGTAFEMGHRYGTMDNHMFGFITFSGFGHGCNVMLSQPSEHHFDYVADMLGAMALAKSFVEQRAPMHHYDTIWGQEKVKAEATE